MSDHSVVPPAMFGDREFAELNKDKFDEYTEYRVHGIHCTVAFRRVFGEEYMDSVSHIRVELTEHNPYFREQFLRRLKAIKVEELWDAKSSLNELLGMAQNPFAKDSTRLNAMRELNIMVGIVIVDENGKTKAGRNLEDFYANLP